MPLVKRTRAIFLMAEFGFLGVLVVTLVQTPRLKGALKKIGRFFKTLNERVKAGVFDLRRGVTRLRFTSWLIVGIKQFESYQVLKFIKSKPYLLFYST